MGDSTMVRDIAFRREFRNSYHILPGETINFDEGRWQRVSMTGEVIEEQELSSPIQSPRDASASKWAIFTQWATANRITKFETTWTVPPAPKNIGGQKFYLFNGLVAGKAGYILQPVLLWGKVPWMNESGDFWTIAGCLVRAGTDQIWHSNGVRVNSGDVLVGRMAQYPNPNSDNSYGVAVDFKGYPDTFLLQKNIPLLSEPVEVLEIYDMDLCSMYPYCYQTRMKDIILQAGDKHLDLKWVARDVEIACGQKAVIVKAGSPGGEIILRYCSPDPPATPTDKNMLKTNQGISVGQSLYSENNRLRLTLQEDGNLVLYTPGNYPLWNSDTAGDVAVWELIMQPDGNLVIYDIKENPIWASKTDGKGGSYFRLEDNAKIGIFNSGGGLIWWGGSSVPDHPKSGASQRDRLVNGEGLLAGESLVSANGSIRLVMQPDGNLVLYGPPSGDQPIWASHTDGNTNVWDATLQDDGNFVVYDVNNKALWASNKFKSGGCTLICQDDGNLVNYGKDGTVIWATASNIPTNRTPNKPEYPYEALDGQGIMCGGAGMTSPNGYVRLMLQKDGNLVLYGTGNQPMWASDTAGTQAWCFRVDQGFVHMYDVKGNEMWSAGRTSGSSWVRVNDDGNVELTDGPFILWDTRTHIKAPAISPPEARDTLLPKNQGFLAGGSLFSANGLYRLTLQGDGNLVLYGPKPLEQALWSSNTAGRDDIWNVRFQPDGNFVSYNWRDGGPIWASNTEGKQNPPVILKVKDEGMVVMLDKDNKEVWKIP